MSVEKHLDKIADLLADEEVRKEVIAFLARDFSKDFLVPVKITFEGAQMGPVSCKEWQE